MKTCKNCGASVNDDSRFCTNCGADTFADGAQEEIAVNAEASAQPETDNTEAAAVPEADSAAAPEQGSVYYQPAGETTESTASSYTYAVPTDQVPVGKGKQKGRGWAIVLSIIVVLGILVRVGIRVADVVLDNIGNRPSISEGTVNSTEYVNNSLNLKIDISGTNFETVSDDDMRTSFKVDPDLYETIIYDYNTGEMIVVFLFEGNEDEVNKDIKEFTHDEAVYYYENESNYKIGDVYELSIGGKTYTCVDIGQNVENATYGDYYVEETLCVLRSGSTFIEIEIFTYPEETGHNGKNLIDQFFKSAK